MDQALRQALAQLRGDSRTGAAELAEQAADVLLRRASTGEAASPDAFRQEMLRMGWAIIEAQPVMAPMVHLVSEVLWELESHETPRALRDAVAHVTARFKRRLAKHSRSVAENALPLLPDGATVVTVSQSSTVLYALRHATLVRRINVICAESRPGCEGREMAEALAESGTPVRLIVDAGAVGAVAQADIVLVGADSLSAGGLVNKVGTRALALAARTSGVPFYSLCSSEKFLPQGCALPPQHPFPAAEIWEDAPASVSIDNYYYDTTPRSEMTGVVTEQGVMTPETIDGWLASTTLYPALVDLLTRSQPDT